MAHEQQQTATINPHLQLCVNDLLHPTEKSESLLEALTSSQLEDIERTLIKIKERKTTLSQQQQNVSPTSSKTVPTISNSNNNNWTMVAAQIAKALADTITTVNNNNNNNTNKTTPSKPPTATTPPTTTKASPTVSTPAQKEKSPDAVVVTNHEPRTEIKDGVEWVSFVYSHHRVLRRYSIRTDVDKVDLSILDDKFKSDNCVYPRANLPREEYKGNRWAYETECNTLGWKLAYLNSTEIAGKRGLIQRAVDSYRNRYPSMRSRRVARQEKLLKGTLRKRKQRDSEDPEEERPTKKVEESSLPKTVSIDDGLGGKHRIRINVESVPLDAIDMEFRKANCVYPRAISINPLSPFASQRQIEEAKCNELAWKLAWLNPKQLAHRKNLLQRVLDVYRTKFLPELNPRRNSLRIPTNPPDHTSIDTTMLLTKNDDASTSPALTVAALAAQQQALDEPILARRIKKNEDDESLYSGTTDSLDFHDCFSPNHTDTSEDSTLLSPVHQNIMLSAPISDGLMLSDSGRLSISSTSSSEPEDQILFKDNFNLYQLPSTDVDFDPSEFIKDEDHLIDPLMSQLFHI